MIDAMLVPEEYVHQIESGERQAIIRAGMVRLDAGTEILMACPKKSWCTKVVILNTRDAYTYNVASVELNDHGVSDEDELIEDLQREKPHLESGDTVTIIRFRKI